LHVRDWLYVRDTPRRCGSANSRLGSAKRTRWRAQRMDEYRDCRVDLRPRQTDSLRELAANRGS
jgi:hypothetical protein